MRLSEISFFIIFSCLYTGTNSNCVEVCVPRKLEDFNDITVSEFVLWTKNVANAALCVSMCSRDIYCMAAGYSPLDQECRGYAVGFTSPDHVTFAADVGAKLYLMCRATNSIGSPCMTSSDCDDTNSACNDGQCKCDIGYSFHARGSTHCVESCSVYGSTFFRFDTKTVGLNNDETHNSVTESQCKEICIQRAWCKSFEFDKTQSTCNLMRKTWLEYSFFFLDTNSDWAFSTRNCRI